MDFISVAFLLVSLAGMAESAYNAKQIRKISQLSDESQLSFLNELLVKARANNSKALDKISDKLNRITLSSGKSVNLDKVNDKLKFKLQEKKNQLNQLSDEMSLLEMKAGDLDANISNLVNTENRYDSAVKKKDELINTFKNENNIDESIGDKYNEKISKIEQTI